MKSSAPAILRVRHAVGLEAHLSHACPSSRSWLDPSAFAVMIPLEKVGSGWRGSQSPPRSCAEDLPTRLLEPESLSSQAHPHRYLVRRLLPLGFTLYNRKARRPCSTSKLRQNWRHSPATRARCDRRQGQEVCAFAFVLAACGRVVWTSPPSRRASHRGSLSRGEWTGRARQGAPRVSRHCRADWSENWCRPHSPH